MRRLLLALLLLGVPGAASAQWAPQFLKPGHSARDAVRRLGAPGLAPAAADSTNVAVTLRHARQVFARAAAATDSEGLTGSAALSLGYVTRLEAESDAAGVLASMRLWSGWTAWGGAALALAAIEAEEQAELLIRVNTLRLLLDEPPPLPVPPLARPAGLMHRLRQWLR
jgi:hypothetical protein